MKIDKKALLFAVVSFVLGVTIGFGGSSLVGVAKDARKVADREFSVPVGVNEIQNSFRNVAQKVLPSIVTVRVGETQSATPSTPNQSPWFDFFFGRPNNDDAPQDSTPDFRARGFGSGVIVERRSNTYYVLTNAHVIGNADEIMVIFSDSSEQEAQLIGLDQRKDLALLSFRSNESIPTAELGDSDGVHVGDWVLAFGSPFNFQSTVTAGIVSAVGRRGGPQGNINDFIQTDAAINQGNSGGALVDISGRVVGINTWITSRTGTNIGLGFAIPINNVKKPIEDFITKGRVEYGWLGISIRTIESGDVRALSLPDARGAFVLNVFEDSPAEKAGILPGDFIVAIEGNALGNSDELLLAVGDYPVGKTATMRLYRQGNAQTVSVHITARDSERTISDQNNRLWPGLRVTDITETIRSRLDLADTARGVVIEGVEPRTPSAIAGLRAGDVITRVNNRQAVSLLTFYDALNSKLSGAVLFDFIRDGQPLSIGITR